jgi:thiol:disulfide interchange protein
MSRRLVFGLVWLASTVALATPLVPAAWRPRPLILGMPPAFAWALLWLAVMFVAVLWLYCAEQKADEARRSSS